MSLSDGRLQTFVENAGQTFHLHADSAFGHLRVNLRGADILMAEHLLYGFEGHAVFERYGRGEGVPSGVERKK